MTDPVRAIAAAVPTRVALRDQTTTLTYAALDRAVERRARQLVGLGVKPGDVVACIVRPDLPGVMLVHAIERAGAVMALLHPGWTAREIGTCLAAVQPTLVVAEDEETLTALSGEPRTMTLAALDAAAEHDVAPDAAASHRYAVLWTSGTTGTPRAVCLTKEGFRASARGAVTRLELRPGDCWYASLSLAHVGGLALVHRAATYGGAVYAPGQFTIADLAGRIADGTVTHVSLVPTMLHQLLQLDGFVPPPTFRLLLLGGAAAPTALIREALDRGLPIARTYGMTETTSQMATAPPALVRRKPDTVGAPLDDVQLRIEETGEILVRGPTLMECYGDAPDPRRDGWFPTGDLGRIDAEGHLYVTGRLDDRIISGGVNVDPREVEEVLVTAPGVAGVLVMGMEDPKWGERVVALVQPEAGSHLDHTALDTWARARLAPAKRPKQYVFVESFPLTTTGKIDRRAARALASR